MDTVIIYIVIAVNVTIMTHNATKATLTHFIMANDIIININITIAITMIVIPIFNLTVVNVIVIVA